MHGNDIFISPLAGVQSIVMSMSFCLSVSSHNSKTTQSIFTKVFVRVTLMALQYLRTCGFVDAQKGIIAVALLSKSRAGYTIVLGGVKCRLLQPHLTDVASRCL